MKSWDFGINSLWPFSLRTLDLRSNKLLGAILGLSVLAASAPLAQANDPGADIPWPAPSKATPVAVSIPHAGLQDGVYLYGNDKNPNQVNTAYFVFRVKQQQVIGAVYMPRSSYDCFNGTIKANHLNLKVLDSYEEQVFEHQVNLNSYHALAQLSETDDQVLQACLNDPAIAALE